MLSRALFRDFVIGAFIIAAYFAVNTQRPEKRLSPNPVDLQAIVPREFEQWKAITLDRSDFKDTDWQAIDNILMREYAREDFAGLGRSIKKIGFVLEYSHDFRNNFSLHFPDN